MAEVPTFKLVLVGDGGTGTLFLSVFITTRVYICLRVFYVYIFMCPFCAQIWNRSSSRCRRRVVSSSFRSETKRRALEIDAWHNWSERVVSFVSWFRDFDDENESLRRLGNEKMMTLWLEQIFAYVRSLLKNTDVFSKYTTKNLNEKQ